MLPGHDALGWGRGVVAAEARADVALPGLRAKVTVPDSSRRLLHVAAMLLRPSALALGMAQFSCKMPRRP